MDEPQYEVSVKGERTTIQGQNLNTIPKTLGEKYADKTKILDLSHNNIRQVENLEKFKLVNSLILDNNQLQSDQKFPNLTSLETLFVNNNNISDLKLFIDCIVKSFPNITYLSMLKNPACPNYFVGKDSDDYQRYRLKKLKCLDTNTVKIKERKEAERVGAYSLPAKPDDSLYKASQPAPTSTDEQYGALPSDLQQEGKGSARIGVATTVYLGVNSEGNRFIMNDDL